MGAVIGALCSDLHISAEELCCIPPMPEVLSNMRPKASERELEIDKPGQDAVRADREAARLIHRPAALLRWLS